MPGMARGLSLEKAPCLQRKKGGEDGLPLAENCQEEVHQLTCFYPHLEKEGGGK